MRALPTRLAFASSPKRAKLRRSVMLAPLLVVAVALLNTSSCGPSVQSIYEGDVRFEHCYRLDLDLNIAASHREACWKQWLGLYTYGQPRDRIEYARRRLRAFSGGDFTRPTLNTGSVQPQRREFYLVVPEPTSAHAPPPPVAMPVYGDAGVPPVPALNSPAPQASAPGASCASACYSSFTSCKAACGPDGGASETACKSCEPDYRHCMRRCFQ